MPPVDSQPPAQCRPVCAGLRRARFAGCTATVAGFRKTPAAAARRWCRLASPKAPEMQVRIRSRRIQLRPALACRVIHHERVIATAAILLRAIPRQDTVAVPLRPDAPVVDAVENDRPVTVPTYVPDKDFLTDSRSRFLVPERAPIRDRYALRVHFDQVKTGGSVVMRNDLPRVHRFHVRQLALQAMRKVRFLAGKRQIVFDVPLNLDRHEFALAGRARNRSRLAAVRARSPATPGCWS